MLEIFANIVDILDLVGLIFVVLIFIVFFRIFQHQHRFIKNNPLIYRLAVLSVRSASVIPGFALCYLISLWIPDAYTFMQLPASYFQAYAIFCLFALFNLYVGGPRKCMEIFRTSDRTFPKCLFGCMNASPRYCYLNAYWAHWQFFFIRPVVVVAYVVAYYLNYIRISIILSIVATGMVCWAIAALFKVYHVLYDYCLGLNATMKLMVIKGTIGLVLGQGFLEEILYAAGVIDITYGSSKFDEANKAIRAYSLAVLVELFLISIWLERIFSKDIDVSKGPEQSFSPNPLDPFPSDNTVGFCGFLSSLFQCMDVFAPVVLKKCVDDLSQQSVLSDEFYSGLTLSDSRRPRLSTMEDIA